MIGRIGYWNNARGFGFITVDATDAAGATQQQQYFFHYSNMVNFKKGEHPTIGALVSFNLGQPLAEGKKAQAIDVKFATPADIAAEKPGLMSPGVTTLLQGGSR